MSSTGESVKRAYDLASLRQRAKSLTRPADWEKARKIITHYQRETHKQETAYHKDYDTRFTRALQLRIDKAGSKNMALKHRQFGSDGFDKTALMRAAHRDVQHDHLKRMALLKHGETKDLDALVATAQKHGGQEAETGQTPKESFARATERRKGAERRATQTRSPSR